MNRALQIFWLMAQLYSAFSCLNIFSWKIRLHYTWTFCCVKRDKWKQISFIIHVYVCAVSLVCLLCSHMFRVFASLFTLFVWTVTSIWHIFHCTFCARDEVCCLFYPLIKFKKLLNSVFSVSLVYLIISNPRHVSRTTLQKLFSFSLSLFLS
jgi:hypothetical protein